jgi:2-methylcitrate dehydratase PrpD
VIAAAKDSFLDTLGIAIAGAVEPGGRLVSKYVAQAGGAAVSSLIGAGIKVPARAAAEANGTLAHVVGFSDFSVPNVLHPSVAVLPAVWAVAEAVRASGRDVLLAHAVGVEVSCKIMRVLTPEFTQRGFHPCAIVGTFGAAAAAAKLLGLDATGIANALGIAGQRAAGIKVSLGTMSKAYAVGNAAAGGVAAAELARIGYTGAVDVLEGRDGFFQTFGAGVEAADLQDLLAHPWEFESPGITIKPYPACTRSHPAIDAALAVKGRIADVDAIERVSCRVAPAVMQVVKVARPRNAMEAKFSLPFCLAAALLDGEVVMDTFTEAKLSSDAIQAFMSRVRPEAVESLAARGPFAAEVTVTLRDGANLQASADRNLWDDPSAATPEKRAQLESKFMSCATRVLSFAEAERALALANALEHEPDIERLMALACRTKSPTPEDGSASSKRRG